METCPVLISVDYSNARKVCNLIENQKFDNRQELIKTIKEQLVDCDGDGGVDDMISTRRMCHIVQTYSIFADRMKSIDLCINRFELDTREAFLDLYTKIDETVETVEDKVEDKSEVKADTEQKKEE